MATNLDPTSTTTTTTSTTQAVPHQQQSQSEAEEEDQEELLLSQSIPDSTKSAASFTPALFPPPLPSPSSTSTSTSTSVVGPSSPAVPRNSILLKPNNGGGKASLKHLEWYQLHNGVPLASRIPAPISQKQRERERQLEREAREREHEKELERERERERAKTEERIWGIPKKALLLGLPDVNFNSHMAMLGGWGNGSIGPTVATTPTAPSKAYLREKLRQREFEKRREAEEAEEPLDPEELAQLNAIINTRRSMALAQALANGQVGPPLIRIPSVTAAPSIMSASAVSSLDPAGLPLDRRPSTTSQSETEGGAGPSRTSDSSSRPTLKHTDSSTSTLSVVSSTTVDSTATATSPGPSPVGEPSASAMALPSPSGRNSVASDSSSPQSPGSLTSQTHIPRIRFAPLPFHPPIDVSPLTESGAESDRASPPLTTTASSSSAAASQAEHLPNAAKRSSSDGDQTLKLERPSSAVSIPMHDSRDPSISWRSQQLSRRASTGSRNLSQSPPPPLRPALSTVAADDDSDDAEFWSPTAIQSFTKTSLPKGKAWHPAELAAMRSRAAREKRLKESSSSSTTGREDSERRDSLNIDYGWSAAHHPSLFDNR
ncbi:hypothetical protein OC846_005680 [Tilletia horrida]|uniref:Uncharacterized protein n=1 Tax=Tilletia horrida TaxID=155126 RepID=A0AAN6GMI7_9BASI|nr:hypothetical protein OC846_005680 [Tilletia horrida]KAK0561885.1 hypothetical protein OC861_005601 [Tilletia horrida]